MKVMVTGGAGYVGSRLVPKLLAYGYQVVVYDRMWFGDGFLPIGNRNLRMVRGDIRNTEVFREAVEGVDTVIHLACISNDTSCGLDPALSTAVNYDCFEPLVIAAKDAGVKRFVFCSSSSVYGSSNADNVTEDHPLIPLTLYNKYKGMCEPLLLKHQAPDFTCVVIRPATVCGPAPRMRFDLTVNILTMHAVKKGVITVFGGGQKRPNLHMDDMCDVYRLLLEAPAKKIAGQVFNIGIQNIKVLDIAKLVQDTVVDFGFSKPSIEVREHTDDRSYHINSNKIAEVLGFTPARTVDQAIGDMCLDFKSGKWQDALTNPVYTNVLQLQEHGFRNRSNERVL
jgi:nucleoside-diphosphate-sugar epimerase